MTRVDHQTVHRRGAGLRSAQTATAVGVAGASALTVVFGLMLAQVPAAADPPSTTPSTALPRTDDDSQVPPAAAPVAPSTQKHHHASQTAPEPPLYAPRPAPLAAPHATSGGS